MTELKPCPFCGSKAWIDCDEPTNINIRCLFCSAIISFENADDENDVINAWNRRTNNAKTN